MSSKILRVAALAGDGIGPEVMREAIKVLRATEKKFGFALEITAAPVGWAGIDAAGKALPDATLAVCKNYLTMTRICRMLKLMCEHNGKRHSGRCRRFQQAIQTVVDLVGCYCTGGSCCQRLKWKQVA